MFLLHSFVTNEPKAFFPLSSFFRYVNINHNPESPKVTPHGRALPILGEAGDEKAIGKPVDDFYSVSTLQGKVAIVPPI